jgi:alcohol dehydrogenase
VRFEHLTPTRVIFGRDRLSELGALTRPLGVRALLVCGRTAMRRHGVLDRACRSLQLAGVDVHVFDGVSRNPCCEEVQAAITLARQQRSEVIVALGGGSAIDTAKAAGAAIRLDSVAALVGTTLPDEQQALPVIAVPTTAGTGAEVTRGAIITDRARCLKSGIRGRTVFPSLALIDSRLSSTTPREVALETAFDALTHAVEGYLARQASPLTDILAERALGLTAPGLRGLAAGEDTPELWDRLALGALLGGLTVATASTCLPHRLQQAMGGISHIELAHGRGLAALYPPWVERANAFAEERFARIAQLIGAASAAEGILDLLERGGLRQGLHASGYQLADIDVFLANVTGNVDNDPIDVVGPPLMRAIYAEAM